MSYDEKNDRMNWKDELSWLTISFISGVILSLFYIYFERFPATNKWVIFAICCLGFYLLSILVRIQNHRGKPLTGKTGIKENHLKFVFPFLGFGIGLILLYMMGR